jgi:hypothetical protein
MPARTDRAMRADTMIFMAGLLFELRDSLSLEFVGEP